MMFSALAISEFADKYSDHLVLTTSAGAGTALSEVWHVIPFELATLITVALFLALRICVERWWHKRRQHRHRAHLHSLHRHPPKQRSRI